MNKFRFVISALLLFSTSSLSQGNQSDPKANDTAATYQTATMVKLTASVRTQAGEVRHTTFLDSTITSEKIVSYQFSVRSGAQQYTARYTPEKQPGNLPQAWWKGNAPIEVRVKKHTLFIKLPEGGEIASHIVNQTPPAAK